MNNVVTIPAKDEKDKRDWRWHCLRLAVKSGETGESAVHAADLFRQYVERGAVPGHDPKEDEK